MLGAARLTRQVLRVPAAAQAVRRPALLPLARPCLCAHRDYAAAASAAAEDDGTQMAPGREAFGKLGGRAPKGQAKTRKPRAKKKSLPKPGKVTPAELHALGKDMGFTDEMITNPDLLDIMLLEAERRQEEARSEKDNALVRALEQRLNVEMAMAKALWNETGGFGSGTSQFKPARLAMAPPAKGIKELAGKGEAILNGVESDGAGEPTTEAAVL